MPRCRPVLSHASQSSEQSIRYPCRCVQAILEETRVKPGNIAAFVELHIEQGPNLEAEKKDIGIVEAIMAPALLRIEFTGRGGHGGERC